MTVIKDFVTNMISVSRWYRGFDWKGLVAGTLSAPLKNPVMNSRDTSNFDSFGDEDDIAEDEFSGWDENF